MKRGIERWMLLGVLLVSGAVLAQEPYRGHSQGWSVLSGETIGQGSNALVGDVGWPGLSVGMLHGATSSFDIGGRLGFNYGREGIVTQVLPGLKLQAWMRLMLVESSKVNVGLTFSPGPFFYFHQGFTEVGLVLPLALTIGIPVGSALMLNIGLDAPFYVTFGSGGGPVVPLLVGGGLEYFIDRQLAVTFNVRMGPSLGAYNYVYYDLSYRNQAAFTLNALIGVAYRL